MDLIGVVDKILFIVFAVNITYLLLFSLFSCKKSKKIVGNASVKKKIAILIPSYKEDKVIEECVESCLAQNYPKDLYDVIVISDRMTEETNMKLAFLPIKLIKVYFENSTKSKALNLAMSLLGDYDIALVLDADNVIGRDFLLRINTSFVEGGNRIVQAHRVAKNTNTSVALLDAVSEEINNSIFRKGHFNAGFSAALIGSGMAFEYALFKKVMCSIDAVGGFDRALELTLLYKKEKIAYLEDAYVYDEKVQNRKDFSGQRRRWLSAQLHYFYSFLKFLPNAVKGKRWDFCDKLFQQMGVPRIILLGVVPMLAILFSFYNFEYGVKWWIIYLVLIISLLLAIPRKLYTLRLLKAIGKLPYLFFFMFLNLFRLKDANKKFIHTSHGI